MATVDKAQPALQQPVRLRGLSISKSTGRRIGRFVTYSMLTLGAVVMLFPIFWMFTASFKPPWQIFTQPPIWIPSEWINVQAGNTTHELPLWWARVSDTDEIEVIKVGTRRYTAAVELAALTPEQQAQVVSAPADQLSSATPTTFDTPEGEITLNVREWTADGVSQRVVAIGRDGDNLIIAPVETLLSVARQWPLDRVNAASRKNVKIGNFNFQSRELDESKLWLPLGPESQLTVVAPKNVAAAAFIVPVDAISKAEIAPVGKTSIQLYTLADRPAEDRFVQLSQDTWQPIIDFAQAEQYGFVVTNDKLPDPPRMQDFNAAAMPVTTFTQSDGKRIDVVVLVKTNAESFVIPVEHTDTLRLTPLKKLALPFVRAFGGVSVQYRDDYEENNERMVVAIVGTRQEMALLVPREAVTDAFDVPENSLHYVLRTRFYVQNYIDALSKDLGGANFLTFFRNSALLVLLNLIGHFLSVTIVAYGFARLRAPGKGILFLILLSTMMLPYPVLLIPTYEIFQNFGMIDTLWPLFVRAFFGNAFLIFLLRQFFTSIPRELEEAARIDGANTLKVLWHVMLPLSKPALATIGIFTFWWTWNSFFEPYIYLSSVKNFTVSLGLAFFKGQYTTSFHLLMAASMVATLPIIIIFFFTQRYFIEGIQLQGLKG